MTEETDKLRKGFEAFIKRIIDKDKEILESLGSDYDEEGIPYWEKWGKKALDKEQDNTIE
jgi:hypothetical protein